MKLIEKAGMNDTQAQEATKGVIQRNWAKWNDRVMKYSPVSYYTPQDGDNAYIMNQLISDVNKDFFGKNLPAENIILVATEETARTASLGQPIYAVKVLDEDGQLITMSDFWMPDLRKELDKRSKETISEQLERRKRHLARNIPKAAQPALKELRTFYAFCAKS